MTLSKLETLGAKLFDRWTIPRRICKRIYQVCCYMLSKDKFRQRGNIDRLTPQDDYEYFYGYYDKCPWDVTNRYVICMKAKKTYTKPAYTTEAEIIVIDTEMGNYIETIGKTHSWNVQQGCMAQWLGPDYKRRIIYNDFREGRYCSVIYDFIEKKEIKVISMPVYEVDKEGCYAYSLDFSRLHRLRPGYGYANIPDEYCFQQCPDTTCLWKIDLKTGDIVGLLKYTELKVFDTKESMEDAEHKINHIMINPNGTRLMLLHRWNNHGKKYTRLITLNTDGTDIYNLSDDDYVSHACWKNDNEILCYLNKNELGKHYYLLKDKSANYTVKFAELKRDGHCTYSPDEQYVVTDNYPDRNRIASIYLCNNRTESIETIAQVYAPFRYDFECRCDLHPRWDRKGEYICFDSVHMGKRGLYRIKL